MSSNQDQIKIPAVDKSAGVVESSPESGRRGYEAPRFLSVEPLEAFAAACAVTNPGGPGKTVESGGCATLGS